MNGEHGGEHWRPNTCPLCGKQFYVPCVEDWAYRIDKRLVCSWHCLRQAEKTGLQPREVVKMAKDGYTPPEHWYRMREMRDAGMSHREIAKAFGVKEWSVGSIISKLSKYERMMEAGHEQSSEG